MNFKPDWMRLDSLFELSSFQTRFEPDWGSIWTRWTMTQRAQIFWDSLSKFHIERKRVHARIHTPFCFLHAWRGAHSIWDSLSSWFIFYLNLIQNRIKFLSDVAWELKGAPPLYITIYYKILLYIIILYYILCYIKKDIIIIFIY